MHRNMRAARQVNAFGRVHACGRDDFAEQGIVEGRVEAEGFAEEGVVEGHLLGEGWGCGGFVEGLGGFGTESCEGFGGGGVV